MNKLFNSLWSQYLKIHRAQMEQFINYPIESQQKELQKIIKTAKDTEWGKRYGFSSFKKTQNWNQMLPLQDYESIKSDIHRMMKGEQDVLWPGRVRYFAKSSGTTSDKSKYIPVTDVNHKNCHSKGGWRLLTCIYDNVADPRIIEGKSILLAGSSSCDLKEFPGSIVGDVSAIIYQQINPIVVNRLYPNKDIALMPDFEKKLDIIAKESVSADIRMVAGTPTWAVVLFKKILESTGKQNILEIWPKMQVFVHGAVSFVPYRQPFKDFFPSSDFSYIETYNASEGYFAVQSDKSSNDMLLLLDNGVFYEFIPMEEWDKENPKTISLEDVEVDKNYALVITTNSGLYRYQIGDTVKFTSTFPFKILITGRTKQFINVFGEEVMVSNTDAALSKTCLEFGVKVIDYTVAPIFLTASGKGGHEWIIEFNENPSDPNKFAEILDENLKKVNSDYEAKRYNDLALERLKLNIAAPSTFFNWMKSRNKIGAQQKVPRLANHREYLEDLKKMISSKDAVSN
ncbi:MAG: GH3 auxin-responsive promoter family protein [Saprospiraceae bacterium]